MKSAPIAVLCLAFVLLGCDEHGEAEDENAAAEASIEIAYLEIVTPDVDAHCATLTKIHGVTFGDPIPALGNARVAKMKGNGRISVRAPMRESEDPVVRPYLFVDDIEAAVKAAREAGAEIAMPPMELPGQGTFAIYIQGGIQHGLWQR